MGRFINDQRGYNLFEMVCVIVIIALLAAIIIPGYISMINQAKKQAMVNDARSFYIAAQAVATQKKATATEDHPYAIPTAEDICQYVDGDEMYKGVTELTVIDHDKDGTIDAITFKKNGDTVELDAGDKVRVNGKDAPLATPSSKEAQ